jgi:8-oxo-dGTP diphosphatase
MHEADIDATVSALGDFEVSRHLARVPHPYTEHDARVFLKIVERGRAEGAMVHFMIVPRTERTPIGAIGLHQDMQSRRAEVGYWIAREHWGRGYAREALAEVVRYAFFARASTSNIPTINILEAKALETNRASIRVLEACGFLDVGAVDCASLATGTTSPARQFELRAE